MAENTVTQISVDDSFPMKVIAVLRELSPFEAYLAETSHGVTACLGIPESEISLQEYPISLDVGKTYILLTEGIYTLLNYKNQWNNLLHDRATADNIVNYVKTLLHSKYAYKDMIAITISVNE